MSAVGDNAEEEMGLAGASADDAEAEYIRKLCEKDIVSGQSQTVGSVLGFNIHGCVCVCAYVCVCVRTCTLTL